MREWLKVALGVLALTTVGASGPTLILYTLNPPTPGGWNAYREREAYSREKHRDGKTAERDSKNTISVQGEQPKNQNAVSPQPKHESEGDSSAEWWVAFWTAALFIATTGLWFFTAALWWTTRKAVIEGHDAIKAAQTSADAAMAQARASERQADIAERSLDSINRPWVDIEAALKEGEGQLALDENQIRVDFIVILRNHGRSPALKVSITIGLYPTFNQAFDSLEKAKRVASSPISLIARNWIVNMIAPDRSHETSHTITAPMPNPDDFPKNTEDGAIGIFVVVCVTYGLGTSHRPRYTGIIFEITHGSGEPFTFKKDHRGIIHAGDLAIRHIGVGDTT